MGRREAPRSRSRTSLWSTPLNSQSTTPKDLVHHSGSLRDEGEEARRVQLVEVTIDSLAEVGYVGTTLAEIARRAGVSPGLVAHYFDDKDGLLEAAFRTLARTLAARMRARLALARTPRGRVQAVIDTNLAHGERRRSPAGSRPRGRCGARGVERRRCGADRCRSPQGAGGAKEVGRPEWGGARARAAARGGHAARAQRGTRRARDPQHRQADPGDARGRCALGCAVPGGLRRAGCGNRRRAHRSGAP